MGLLAASLEEIHNTRLEFVVLIKAPAPLKPISRPSVGVFHQVGDGQEHGARSLRD